MKLLDEKVIIGKNVKIKGDFKSKEMSPYEALLSLLVIENILHDAKPNEEGLVLCAFDASAVKEFTLAVGTFDDYIEGRIYK